MSNETQKPSSVFNWIAFGVIPVFFLLLPAISWIAAYFMPADSEMGSLLKMTAVHSLAIIALSTILGGAMIVFIKNVSTMSLRVRRILGFNGFLAFMSAIVGIIAVRFAHPLFWPFLGMAFVGVAALSVAICCPPTPEPIDTD